MGKVYCLDRTPWLGPNPVWQSNLILSSSSRFHSSGFCNSDEFCSKSNCVLWEMNLCHFLLFYFFKSVLEFFRLVDECRGIFLFHWYHPIRELLIYIYIFIIHYLYKRVTDEQDPAALGLIRCLTIFQSWSVFPNMFARTFSLYLHPLCVEGKCKPFSFILNSWECFVKQFKCPRGFLLLIFLETESPILPIEEERKPHRNPTTQVWFRTWN